MKKLKNVPFLALLFLLLSIGSSSFLQAQITYCLEFEATADCNNATVEVFLVHDAPTPTLDIGGIPHFYIELGLMRFIFCFININCFIDWFVVDTYS